MPSYVLYDTAGKIVATIVGGSFELANNVPAGISAVEGHADPGKDYVQLTPSPAIAARQAIAPTISGATVSGLPIPCTITIQGSDYVVTDGTFTLSADFPGLYHVRLSSGPAYFDATIEVTV